MKMPVMKLIPTLLLVLLAHPCAEAQERDPEKVSAKDQGATPVEEQKADFRQRTRFRVSDREGKPWVGARIVAYSRPGEGIVDRVEGVSGRRGRASMRLLPGRSYAAWAWSPVEKSSIGEYRITKLNLRVGTGGISSLQRQRARASGSKPTSRAWTSGRVRSPSG